ncbi:hypothetical protein OIU76_012872 [Salix suchowensis]|nr:hypothetical protein OIU76_012872 [Salix suchowensis]
MASTYDNLITGRIWMFSCKIEETPDWSNIVLQEEAVLNSTSEFNQGQAAVAFILLTEKLIEGKTVSKNRTRLKPFRGKRFILLLPSLSMEILRNPLFVRILGLHELRSSIL